jgi:hypothetical protein
MKYGGSWATGFSNGLSNGMNMGFNILELKKQQKKEKMLEDAKNELQSNSLELAKKWDTAMADGYATPEEYNTIVSWALPINNELVNTLTTLYNNQKNMSEEQLTQAIEGAKAQFELAKQIDFSDLSSLESYGATLKDPKAIAQWQSLLNTAKIKQKQLSDAKNKEAMTYTTEELASEGGKYDTVYDGSKNAFVRGGVKKNQGFQTSDEALNAYYAGGNKPPEGMLAVPTMNDNGTWGVNIVSKTKDTAAETGVDISGPKGFLYNTENGLIPLLVQKTIIPEQAVQQAEIAISACEGDQVKIKKIKDALKSVGINYDEELAKLNTPPPVETPQNTTWLGTQWQQGGESAQAMSDVKAIYEKKSDDELADLALKGDKIAIQVLKDRGKL